MRVSIDRMTTPENVYNEALTSVFRLLDLAILGDQEGMAAALDEATADRTVARQVLAHSLGILLGVGADHYPGGVIALQDDLKRKYMGE